MTQAHVFAIGLALATFSGIRAYLTVFGVGPAGLMGWVKLPAALQVTTSPWILGTAGGLALVYAHPLLALALVLGQALSLFGAVFWLARLVLVKLRGDPPLSGQA